MQHFGSKGGECTVSVEVKDTINSFSLVKQTGTYFSQEDETYRHNGFDVMFDHPVCLEKGVVYTMLMQARRSERMNVM